VVSGMGPGKGYIDVSTVDAATSQEIGAAVHDRGGAFLEAPVSGSKGPAEQGQLIFLAAGLCVNWGLSWGWPAWPFI
jgi:glyoxylate/succinic semialdehyde reductase